MHLSLCAPMSDQKMMSDEEGWYGGHAQDPDLGQVTQCRTQ
jgi:hypothetical protein